MANAPPAYFDPAQPQHSMPYVMNRSSTPATASVKTQSTVIDVLKVLVGLIIIVLLGALLAVLIFLPHKFSDGSKSESNEKIIKILADSNERIARLQREQIVYIETERHKYEEALLEKHRAQDRMIAQQTFQRQLEIENHRINQQYNMTELHREEDRMVEQRRLEQQLGIAMEQLRQQASFQERRLELLAAQNKLTEAHQKDDFDNQHTEKLSSFMQGMLQANPPWSKQVLEMKVHTLLEQFDPHHKSLLIKFLYKYHLLDSYNPNHGALDLREADLSYLNLNGTGGPLGHVGGHMNYSRLSLPFTYLVNGSFHQIILNQANFSYCDLTGASFRLSMCSNVTFFGALLSFVHFESALIYHGNFSSTAIRNSSFARAQISNTVMKYSKLESTSFRHIMGRNISFAFSSLNSTDFSNSNLVAVDFTGVLAHATNFTGAKVQNGSFSNSDFSNSSFVYADLKGASFRRVLAAGSNFAHADVQDVDFTEAFLVGANITKQQLATALSVAHAQLPDGSIGKNKNLLINGNLHCAQTRNVIESWSHTGNFFIKRVDNSTKCTFQAKTANATITQTVDIGRFRPIITRSTSRIFLEMEAFAPKFAKTSNAAAYMKIRFLNGINNQIGSEHSLLNQVTFRAPSTHTTSIPCPSDAVKLHITIVFHDIDTVVDSVYVTMD